MRKIRIIIAGSREFKTDDHYRKLRETMDAYIKNLNLSEEEEKQISIISGCASGADTLGEEYAEEKNYWCTNFPADWKNLGKAAGSIRNKQMADYALEEGYEGHLVVFWNGTSRGTLNMINIASKLGLKTTIVKF